MTSVLSGGSVGAEVWEAYTAAFQNFSEEVRNLQRLTDDPTAARAEIEAAVLAVEKARIAYSEARDAAAELLLDSPLRSATSAEPNSSPAHTAEIAELLWEGAGKPEGTAEADWYRAEEIIRLARSRSLQACC
jgi:uncharacterized protein (DUF2267 family)